ncbi:MAG: SDR family oxidoreductase [Bdellovibrionaceae bacterium]|nr:SDR family oxidoreductase [Pseudobdellovibrionaceae bacterium]
MKTALVLGAAGFIGSHLVDFLLNKNYTVIGVDNFVTGRKKNLAHLSENKNFSFVEADITDPSIISRWSKLDEIYNMASPASPVDFTIRPVFILQTGAVGQTNMLELAKKTNARVLFASTSEVYGDPLQHPQVETYWGNVNPIGIRGCYDEAKRFGEAITMAYHRLHGVNTAIARIFNTYGTRMRPEDGRVIPNFFSQAAKKQSLTIYGDGKQTRSLCYVSDLVEGLFALMQSGSHEPMNIGNPREMTILELADAIKKITGNTEKYAYQPLPSDDPKQRCPDIDKAKTHLKWAPKVSLEHGLKETFEYFKNENIL